MNLINIFCLILAVFFIFYLLIESFLIKKYRSSIKCVIHVNGIRGKTTITRLIDSGLREMGYKVMSKTTGTIPTIIDINNNEIEIKRRGPSNIKEQVKMLRKAYKDHVDYLVLECMAVNPFLQKVCEENILKANIAIVSNVREDHIGEMGDNKLELAEALSNVTPTSGYLIIDKDNKYKDIFNSKCLKKNSKLVISDEYNGECFDTFKDNIEIALKVADILNLDKNKYLKGLSKYKKDVGSLSLIKKENSTLINGFSINDIDSIMIVYDKVKDLIDTKDLTILINLRSDRAGRTNSLFKIFSLVPFKKVILTGSNTEYLKKRINKNYPMYDVIILNKIESLLSEKYIFAIGNIKDDGFRIIDFYKRKEK